MLWGNGKGLFVKANQQTTTTWPESQNFCIQHSKSKLFVDGIVVSMFHKGRQIQSQLLPPYPVRSRDYQEYALSILRLADKEDVNTWTSFAKRWSSCSNSDETMSVDRSRCIWELFEWNATLFLLLKNLHYHSPNPVRLQINYLMEFRTIGSGASCTGEMYYCVPLLLILAGC